MQVRIQTAPPPKFKPGRFQNLQAGNFATHRGVRSRASRIPLAARPVSDRSWHGYPGSTSRYSRSSPTDTGLALGRDFSTCAPCREERTPRIQHELRPHRSPLARTKRLRARTRPHRRCDEDEGEQSNEAAPADRRHPATRQSQNRCRLIPEPHRPAAEQYGRNHEKCAPKRR